MTGSKLKNAADVVQDYLYELENKGRPRVGGPEGAANEASGDAASGDGHSGRENIAAVKSKHGHPRKTRQRCAVCHSRISAVFGSGHS